MSKLKSINLQVYIMLIAIVVIMAFFFVATDGAYLSARNISNLLRQTSITGNSRHRHDFRDYLCRN
ncbi:hypothetical protein SA3733_06705 [Aggregatibacter actinomycetemcomitans serotype d str. SA3733]|nr:hypothetical protein SA508_03085 [Aggregatibacter actinomycetemcomitans serotype d str. SA508]KYK94017.1 hypothetical protein SA269_01735 [Aggregatibacter actinomycetemcomitans serotype d str. SA269]KYK94452.1 hypothetical protein SA3733_06705 [Aggregatibacter actinomycetemcomitans serotype d str. SA3733]BAS47459.1 monosaccharide-transporting ATPase [Aggregatibacter actinomycetemcomitans NUM4039]